VCFSKKKSFKSLNFRKKRLTLHTFTLHQGWGAGKFFIGSGSLHFFQAAPAPDFLSPSGSGSGSWFFFQAAPAPAPRSQKHPAPAPDYWLSLPKYSFPHKLVR
jgi:hypothetical protein